MNTLLTLLPIYVLGNFHCAGMCGPLVMVLAKHPYRWGYFLGRLLSFTLAGLISAEMGITLFSLLARYHISALFSLFFSSLLLLLGASLFFNFRIPLSDWLGKRSARLSLTLSKLMLQNSLFAVFLFGMSTLLLPCGQIVVVYSIIALNCSPLMGLLNGFLFALLTSPALIMAMRLPTFLRSGQKNYRLWMGGATLLVGALAFLRGLADFAILPHLILNPHSPSQYHVVLF